jgi:hypothetical protein
MVDPTTQQQQQPEQAVPQEAPPLTNPPATLGQADRARAALGGSPGVTAAQARLREMQQAASGEWNPNVRNIRGPVKTARFQPPAELEFEFTPQEPQEIRNNNVPLTIGLLFSIVAAFVVFLVSMGSSNVGVDDPILTAFWRALGALAVLVTLSFAASWFMPTPPNRRQLLDQLEAEDRALGHYRTPEPSFGASMDAELPMDSPTESTYDDMGGSVDVMLDDDELFDNIDDFAAQTTDDDFYDDIDDFIATTPSAGAVVPFDEGEDE